MVGDYMTDQKMEVQNCIQYHGKKARKNNEIASMSYIKCQINNQKYNQSEERE